MTRLWQLSLVHTFGSRNTRRMSVQTGRRDDMHRKQGPAPIICESAHKIQRRAVGFSRPSSRFWLLQQSIHSTMKSFAFLFADPCWVIGLLWWVGSLPVKAEEGDEATKQPPPAKRPVSKPDTWRPRLPDPPPPVEDERDILYTPKYCYLWEVDPPPLPKSLQEPMPLSSPTSIMKPPRVEALILGPSAQSMVVQLETDRFFERTHFTPERMQISTFWPTNDNQ